MEYGDRQVRRIEKAIDELIKIADDGKATGTLHHCLDTLRELQSYYQDKADSA